MQTGLNNAEETCLKNLTNGFGRTVSNTSASLNPTTKKGDVASIVDPQLPGLVLTRAEKDAAVGLDEEEKKLGASRNESISTATEFGVIGQDAVEYPEGGLRAWLVVFGAFCALMMVFGVVNSTGAFQAYFSTHQLQGYTPSQIGWIFSLELFLVFFCGVYLGPIFDKYGPRVLVALGSFASIASMILLSVSTEYWQFIMSYSVLGGISGALLMSPAYACVAHFFNKRRGLATGIASVSGSVGGIIVPIMLQNLLPKVGFAWSARILAFLFVLLAIPANLFLARRFKSDTAAFSLLPHLGVLRNPSFALCTIGMFFMEWGLFMPLSYISTYAEDHGHSASFAFAVLALMNAGSFVGRFAPGWIADYVGRFNMIICTITLCVITVLALWLPTGNSKPLLIVFAVSFGFASGSNIGLIATCLGQLCKAEDYGKYFSAAYFVASFGTLTSIPIGGQLLVATGGSYWALILFTGLAYAAALMCFIASRVLAVGWKPRTFF